MLRSAGALGLGLAFGGWPGAAAGRVRRAPGSLPFPELPEGTDTLAQIEHIIILMMENHSYDNYLGTLDRGNGFNRHHFAPRAANPDGEGHLIHAFHIPTTCPQEGPGQSWNSSHTAFGHGRNDGFVLASGPIAMGYWTADDLPFYHGLADTFPLATRWFCSTLCQTYPNRRFLMAGTAAGIIDTSAASLQAPPPPNGNIFERLDMFDIPWRNYYTDLPSSAILLAYAMANQDKLLHINQFYLDAAAGALPAVSLVDPGYVTGQSEEGGDIQVGEQFVAQVINAVMSGPGWGKTVLVWLYDEHGGYYDHVPPPRAIKPDDIPPMLGPDNLPGGYDRYGFRVPAVVVSPYARANFVSHTTRDHTAILKFIERKWNLGALTFRDANADDLSDCLDFGNPPAFFAPPPLPSPALAANPPPCVPDAPGTIPPADAISPGPKTAPGHARAFVRSPERQVRMGEPLAEVWAKALASRRDPT